jgi:5-methylcytosine-specific restriction endonuclease McrA
MDEQTLCIGECGRRAVHMHHVVFLSKGGKEILENMAPVCHVCHNDIHAHLATVRKRDGKWVLKRIGRDARC